MRWAHRRIEGCAWVIPDPACGRLPPLGKALLGIFRPPPPPRPPAYTVCLPFHDKYTVCKYMRGGRVHRPPALAVFQALKAVPHRFLNPGLDDPMKRVGGCVSVPRMPTWLLQGSLVGWLSRNPTRKPLESYPFLSGSAETAAGTRLEWKPRLRTQ